MIRKLIKSTLELLSLLCGLFCIAVLVLVFGYEESDDHDFED